MSNCALEPTPPCNEGPVHKDQASRGGETLRPAGVGIDGGWNVGIRSQRESQAARALEVSKDSLEGGVVDACRACHEVACVGSANAATGEAEAYGPVREARLGRTRGSGVPVGASAAALVGSGSALVLAGGGLAAASTLRSGVAGAGEGAGRRVYRAGGCRAAGGGAGTECTASHAGPVAAAYNPAVHHPSHIHWSRRSPPDRTGGSTAPPGQAERLGRQDLWHLLAAQGRHRRCGHRRRGNCHRRAPTGAPES